MSRASEMRVSPHRRRGAVAPPPRKGRREAERLASAQVLTVGVFVMGIGMFLMEARRLLDQLAAAWDAAATEVKRSGKVKTGAAPAGRPSRLALQRGSSRGTVRVKL